MTKLKTQSDKITPETVHPVSTKEDQHYEWYNNKATNENLEKKNMIGKLIMIKSTLIIMKKLKTDNPPERHNQTSNSFKFSMS